MKRYIISLLLAAAAISCSDKLEMTPAVSFFADEPEISDYTATFRLAASFITDSTERVFPVTFGGTAEEGVDYTASTDAFVLGGESPVDSIVVTTLKFGTEKTVTLTVSLPEGTDGGKYLTSGFTIQDNPAYITFEKDFSILTDSTTIAFSLMNKKGRETAISQDVRISIITDLEKSTAVEGEDFYFTDSTHFTIKAGNSKGELKIARPDSSPAAGKDKVFFKISHDELYGDGDIPEIEYHLMDKKWSRLDGEWRIDSLITDSKYMSDYWGDAYSGMNLLPEFNKYDNMEFDMDRCLFEPSFYSDMKYYFLDETDFRVSHAMEITAPDGTAKEIQTFLIGKTNRYFSSDERSEDKKSYIGLMLTEGLEETADTLDLYIIDHTSRSFMPELESEGKYAPEKPVAASPGLYLNARFTKDR